MNRLFIDPSIISMGWAFWNVYDFESKKPPTKTGLIISKNDLWTNQVDRQIDELEYSLRHFSIDIVYCEFPSFMQSNKGMVAARSGALLKLTYMVGEIHSLFRKHRRTICKLIPVAVWKGQLPKSVVIQRITKILGKKNCRFFRDDIWDAVGMGLWKMGRL